MRLIFMGTPTFAIPVLASLTSLVDSEVVAVYTPPDRPAGRGRKAQPSPVKEYAIQRGLRVVQPANFRSEEVQTTLVELRPDAIIVAAYGRLLPKPVLDLPPLGCLNVHPSLLPRHRGPGDETNHCYGQHQRNGRRRETALRGRAIGRLIWLALRG